ncbi:MAG: hypothetical protein K0U40_11110 [Betaproteobacteria bacterium]|nr:hypothetical protein [Betaproteobacteria bacterium]
MLETEQVQEELDHVIAVAQGFRAAIIDNDWNRACDFMTYEAIAKQIAIIIYGCGYSPWAQKPKVASSLTALLTRHGIDFQASRDFPKGLKLAPALVELMAWLENNTPLEAGVSQEQQRENMRATSFSDFKLTEVNKARATQSDNERKRRIQFLKINNKWLISASI